MTKLVMNIPGLGARYAAIGLAYTCALGLASPGRVFYDPPHSIRINVDMTKAEKGLNKSFKARETRRKCSERLSGIKTMARGPNGRAITLGDVFNQCLSRVRGPPSFFSYVEREYKVGKGEGYKTLYLQLSPELGKYRKGYDKGRPVSKPIRIHETTYLCALIGMALFSIRRGQFFVALLPNRSIDAYDLAAISNMVVDYLDKRVILDPEKTPERAVPFLISTSLVKLPQSKGGRLQAIQKLADYDYLVISYMLEKVKATRSYSNKPIGPYVKFLLNLGEDERISLRYMAYTIRSKRLWSIAQDFTTAIERRDLTAFFNAICSYRSEAMATLVKSDRKRMLRHINDRTITRMLSYF